MKTHSRFQISLVNNPNRNIPSHWDTDVSVRETRAIRKARKIARTNGNAMLFKVDDKGNLTRISIRQPVWDGSKLGNGHNCH